MPFKEPLGSDEAFNYKILSQINPHRKDWKQRDPKKYAKYMKILLNSKPELDEDIVAISNRLINRVGAKFEIEKIEKTREGVFVDTKELTSYGLLREEVNSAYNSGSGTTIDGSYNIDLGGALDAPTIISGTEVNNLSLNFSDAADRSAKLVFQAADGFSMRGYSTDAYGGDSGFFAVDSNKIVMAQYKGGTMKAITMDTITGGIVFRDDIDGIGLVSYADYSPIYSDRSVTDYLWQLTHLGGQDLNSTVYAPEAADHEGVITYDSTGRATGADFYKLTDVVSVASAAGMIIEVMDTILYSNTSATTIKSLPVAAVIHDIYVYVVTTFNGSGTDLLEVGITGTGNRYEDNLDIAVAASFPTMSLTNIRNRMAGTTNIIFQYFDQNSDASAGLALVYVQYSIH